MRKERGVLLGVARRYSHGHQDAEDALEEACVAFLRHFDGGSPDHAERWMRVTVKHAALAIVRRNNTRRSLDGAPRNTDRYEEWWEHALADPGSSPEERFERREWTTTRADLLAELKPDERAALVLSALGYSYLEIGERKGWTQRKVNRCMAEGRARLRELLSARGEES